MLHVVENLAVSVTQSLSRSFELVPLSRACASSYYYSLVTTPVSCTRTVSETANVE